MDLRTLLVAGTTCCVLVTTACSGGAGSTEEPSSEDALVRADLKQHGMAVGMLASGADARKLYEDIKASGGKDLGNDTFLAGLTGEEAGFTDPEDAKQAFGITCHANLADSTFRGDMCSLYAVVKLSEQETPAGGGYIVHLTGKLAKAIAYALPRTGPAGVVGSVTTGSGGVACKRIPGPAPAKCTMPAVGDLASFDEMMRAPESKLKAADARKIIKAFL